MRTRTGIRTGAATAVLALALAGTGVATGSPGGGRYGQDSARITNRYLPISKFDRCVLRGKDGRQRLEVVRVLQSRTKLIHFGGRTVRAAVVRDTVTALGPDRKIERTFDYFAQDRRGGVHYIGEDVDEYLKDGSVSHEGQWRAGRDGARPGLLMPANTRVGRKFRSENAPGIAVERDTIAAKGLTQTIRGENYRHVIRIREHATVPKPGEFETKTYAPGVGVITEANGGVRLVGCSG